MLEVKVTKKLPGFSLNVDFSINNEILAILGPSGAGKTMTLQSIAGLIKPDEGRIALNGRVLFDSKKGINLPPRMRRIGFVFQNYALFPHLTVKANIAYGISHLPRQEITGRVSRFLDIMNISGLGDCYPAQLSSGQQQRVALARALVPEPELLLLDEPFSALDTVRKERLEVELAALQKSYKGNMLLVTHDLAQGYKLSSRMAIFDSGRIIQFGNKENVIAAPANRTAARLTGFKNLLEGTISEVKGSHIWVRAAELGVFKAAIKEASNLQVNQTVTIAIRPEYVRLVEKEGENTLPCRVGQVVEGVSSISYRFYLKTSPPARYYLEGTFSKSDSPVITNGQLRYLHLPPEHLAIITG